MSQEGQKGSREVRVAPMPAERAEMAGDLLAASHENYPAFRLTFRNAGRRRRILRSFMAATSRDAARHGLALGAEDSTGLAGVALWMPPGTFPLNVRRKIRMLPAMLGILLRAPTALPRFARAGATLEASVPDLRGWYLQAMGVHPRAQRSGFGKRLMIAGLSQVDEDRSSCHLHTSDPANIGYYSRFGFEVAGDPIRVGRDGPEYHLMMRPPESDRASPPNDHDSSITQNP